MIINKEKLKRILPITEITGKKRVIIRCKYCNKPKTNMTQECSCIKKVKWNNPNRDRKCYINSSYKNLSSETIKHKKLIKEQKKEKENEK